MAKESAARKQIEEYLGMILERAGSDLHLTVGQPPMLRIDGELVAIEEVADLTSSGLKDMAFSLLTERQQKSFEEDWELDFGYALHGKSRFRGNLMYQRGTISAAFRCIPEQPFTCQQLGLSPVVEELCRKPRGLVLVTGATGSGKSTTLAAMVDFINSNFARHIVTVEDPLEFIHRRKKGIVRQRELGIDTRTFGAALKHVLRQDPDVIMVGEMRDLETVSLTITAAETGHLALATLHTRGAASAVERIIDVFPPHQQHQVRLQLSMTLLGVLSQVLVKRQDGRGRAMAMEILLGTPACRTMIRDAKTHQLNSVIFSGTAVGMCTLDQALRKLYEDGVITLDEALANCNDTTDFHRYMEPAQSVVFNRGAKS